MTTLTPARIPAMSAGQEQKEVTFNEAMIIIGTLMAGVKSATVAAPPTDAVDGDAFIIPADGTGPWAMRQTQVAFYQSGWRYILPFPGPQLWVVDEGQWWTYDEDSETWGAYNPGAGVVGPGSSVVGNIAVYGNTGGDTLGDSGVAISTDGTMASDSDDKVPTEKAVNTRATTAENAAKSYADSLAVGLWDDRGSFDASVNAYPSSGGSGTAGAILKGDIWTISVSGTLPTGKAVDAGDTVRALIDTPGNTQANWAIGKNNLQTSVSGNAGTATALQTARNIDGQAFDGTANITVIAPGTNAASSKATPVDADEIPLVDSAAGNVLKKLTWANLKATLKTYFDTLYGNRDPSVQSVSSSATVTPTFTDDLVKITAQAAGLTLANPTGTAVEGRGLAIRIKDNGTARSISYGSEYRAIGVTLPATTVLGKTLYLGLIYNITDTKWDVVAVAQEA